MKTEHGVDDIRAAAAMCDYNAVGTLWDALLKLSIEMPGKDELGRMKELLRRLTPPVIEKVLKEVKIRNIPL